MTNKKKWLIPIIIVLIPVFLAILLIGGYLASVGISMATADTSGTATESKYLMDEEDNFIANIPYEEYLDYDDTTTYGQVYSILTLGASPSKMPHENYPIIQQAIDLASTSGGGTVLVDGGTFRTMPIVLKDNVTLKIAKDSCLENITYDERNSYGELTRNSWAFIQAQNAKNIRIVGPGRIAGNGATYCYEAQDSSAFLPLNTFDLKTYITEHRKRILMGKDSEYGGRYNTLGINYCENVEIINLEIYEAASWTCRMEGNNNLKFENVIINNNVNVANTDGIDIVGGSNTIIKHCFIATGDDAICLKTEKNSIPIDNMQIENCEIMSLANCFKTGTDVYKDISNITLKDCYFFMAGIAGGYSGIAIESPDGGVVSNINIDNVIMENVTSPLLIWLGKRKGIGELKDITITNIKATNCDIASAVTGHDYGKDTLYVKNVKLENFDVTYREAKENINLYFNDAYEGNLNMGGYPEITRVSHMYLINHTLSVYCDIPVYGLFARHVDGLTVKNFNVKARTCNKREFTNINVKDKKYDIINSTIN